MADVHMFGDKEYSLVPARIKRFREENPYGDIDTVSTINPDGSITFKATIIRDRSNEFSARATGTARYTEAELKRPKSFEKLETVSIGRALSVLGYLNDGQVASTEEMEEFYTAKEQEKQEFIMQAVDAINKCVTIDELKNLFLSLGELTKDQVVIDAKNNMKLKLEELNNAK